jgi:uracil-DNA glycosylase family 4
MRKNCWPAAPPETVNIRENLLALNGELRRLKAEGRRSITVSEEHLQDLRRAVQTLVAERPEVANTAQPDEVLAAASDELAPAGPAAPAPAIPAEPPVVTLPEGDKRTRWEALRALVLNDPVCRAHVRPGKQVVFGVGDLDAKIFFCGEAPGAEEEMQGEPFVGPAGQLLTRMIGGMGLRREDVYIGNIMNWRPKIETGEGEQYGNRPPTPRELNFCLPFLKAQLAIVQPQVVVALGTTAAAGLLGAGTFKTLGEIRGRWHAFSSVPLMVTYHPSYILRSPTDRMKRMIWEDLLKVMERAGMAISARQRNYYLK